jgi:hypothetical protein
MYGLGFAKSRRGADKPPNEDLPHVLKIFFDETRNASGLVGGERLELPTSTV